MGAGEIKREGFNEMLAVLCQLQVELELARKSGEKEFPLKVGRRLHREILNAIEIATNPPSKDKPERPGEPRSER